MKTKKFRLTANVNRYKYSITTASGSVHITDRQEVFVKTYLNQYQIEECNLKTFSKEALNHPVLVTSNVYVRGERIELLNRIEVTISKEVDIQYLLFKPTVKQVQNMCENRITVEEI